MTVGDFIGFALTWLPQVGGLAGLAAVVALVVRGHAERRKLNAEAWEIAERAAKATIERLERELAEVDAAAAARAKEQAGRARAMEARIEALEKERGELIDRLTTALVRVEALTAEVDRMRGVEAADKRRIAELEARVRELEDRARDAMPRRDPGGEFVDVAGR